VDAVGPADAQTASTVPWKSLRDFHKRPPPSLRLMMEKPEHTRACARERTQTILTGPTAWPLFKRSSVAAFERSVTLVLAPDVRDERRGQETRQRLLDVSAGHRWSPVGCSCAAQQRFSASMSERAKSRLPLLARTAGNTPVRSYSRTVCSLRPSSRAVALVVRNSDVVGKWRSSLKCYAQRERGYRN